MSNSIKKITDLQNVEGFIQIDLVRGFKYIDRAGEIVNYFHKNGSPPVFHMDINRLIIKNPDTSTADFKVSSKDVWGHYHMPDSLDHIENLYEKYTKDVCEILEVDEIKRVGWRNYFIYEFGTGDQDKREEVLSKFMPNPNFKLSEVLFSLENQDIVQKIKVVRAEKKIDNPPPAILFDVDSYIESDTSLHPKDAGGQLQKIKNQLRSESFLEAINSVLAK